MPQLDVDAHLFRRAFGSNDEIPVAYEWGDNSFAGDYLANLRIVEAVYRSAAEGRRVEL